MSLSRGGLRRALQRWRTAGLIDAATAERIAAFEGGGGGAALPGLPVLLAWAFGGVLLAAGLFLFVAAHWDRLAPGGRFSVVLAMVLVLHAGAAAAATRFPALAAVLHAVGTAALGGGIFLAGQIFHLQALWPQAFLLWSLGAWAAWALLRQWPQALWAAVLTPWWLGAEWATAAEHQSVSPLPLTTGLALLAVAYLAALGPDRESPTRRGLAWVGGLGLIPATLALAASGEWMASDPTPTAVLALGWAVALAGPSLLHVLLTRKADLAPPLLALLGALLLASTTGDPVDAGSTPLALWRELGPYAVCLAGAQGLVVWGVRDRRPERVNLGVAGFAVTICVYYFSSVMDKLGRSLSLLGLGLLFLVLGWALERTRRRLLARLEREETGGAVR